MKHFQLEDENGTKIRRCAPSNDTQFIFRSPLLTERHWYPLCAVSDESRIFAIGGLCQTHQKGSLQEVQNYSMRKNKWRVSQKLKQPVWAAGACCWRTQNLFVFGGKEYQVSRLSLLHNKKQDWQVVPLVNPYWKRRFQLNVVVLPGLQKILIFNQDSGENRCSVLLNISKQGLLGFIEKLNYPVKQNYIPVHKVGLGDQVYCVELTSNKQEGNKNGWTYRRGGWEVQHYQRK